MSISLFNHTVSIIGFIKDNTNFVGTYAWSAQVGYNEFVTLMGDQSDTAHNISIGDVVGLSVLSKDQVKLASYIGDKHSKELNKLEGFDVMIKDNAILFNNAKIKALAKVKDIMHLEGIESDYLVYFELLETNVDDSKDYLLMSDMKF